MAQNVYHLSIAEVSERIKTRALSPVELVRVCLDRIEQLNPKLNAFITVLADQALAQAEAAELEIRDGLWRGPLHGIPLGIKDFYDTAGVRTTGATAPLKDRIPDKDAACVAKLKAAGAIIVGKTNMHELGFGTTGLTSYFGPARNPWNVDYVPGGSSSGSAVAVASGLCFATVDTDAVGSVRLPAACCGVIGFKGTYALVDPQGILEGTEDPGEMIHWLNHVGITTRTATDTALMLDVLADRPAQPQYRTKLNENRELQLRIGIANNFAATAEVKSAFDRAVQAITDFSLTISEVAIPTSDPMRGFAHIEEDRVSIMDELFADIDVLLLPTTTSTVPTVVEVSGNDQALSPENTVFANYLGLPAISVPNGFDTYGLPLGLEIVGKPWHENAVLGLAARYQSIDSSNTKHPN